MLIGTLKHLLARAGVRPAAQPVPNLVGDRELEWTFVAARLGRYLSPASRVLDFGAGSGVLSFAAASLGARVLAVDLLDEPHNVAYPNLEFRQADVMELPPDDRPFDLIVNCSTIEHVGLPGRYTSRDAPEGDLGAMARLRELLRESGHMLLTLPVGRDAVFPPLHRVYGRDRLPRLLEGFRRVEAAFWRKDSRNVWVGCDEPEALAEAGSEHYYAIGCMVLQRA